MTTATRHVAHLPLMVSILDTLDEHPDGLRFGPLRVRVGGSKKGLYTALGDLAETGEIKRQASVYVSVRDYEGETVTSNTAS